MLASGREGQSWPRYRAAVVADSAASFQPENATMRTGWRSPSGSSKSTKASVGGIDFSSCSQDARRRASPQGQKVSTRIEVDPQPHQPVSCASSGVGYLLHKGSKVYVKKNLV